MVKPVLSSAEIAQAELTWAQQHDGKTWPLMEKAAHSFVRRFLTLLRHKEVIVAAGAGNNGGDGFLIAKLLHEAGIAIQVTAPLGLPDTALDAHEAYQRYRTLGVPLVDDPEWERFDVVIDALFGSGLNRPLPEKVVAIVNQINQSAVQVLAVDMPTGLHAISGEPQPVALSVRSTHSFIALKPGLLTGNGPRFAGTVSLDTLGIDVASQWHLVDEYSLPERTGNTHKSNHGQVLVVGGLDDMAGAALLAANAALFGGAGRVLVHCNPDYFAAAVAQTPELMPLRDFTDAAITQSVVVAGPGMGRGKKSQAAMRWLLASAGTHGVLDADALRYLADFPQALGQFVLTPHEGEAAALLCRSAADVAKNRVAAVTALSDKFHTTVVLKGAGTLVASAGRLTFCHPGTPKMSTPGMGDCLAGVIATLIAQGQHLEQAAINGVNWHARLAAKLAEAQRVVLATDIIALLKRQIC